MIRTLILLALASQFALAQFNPSRPTQEAPSSGGYSGNIPFNTSIPINESIDMGRRQLAHKALTRRRSITAYLNRIDLNLMVNVAGNIGYNFDPSGPSGSAHGNLGATVSGRVGLDLSTTSYTAMGIRGRRGTRVVHGNHYVSANVNGSASISFSAHFRCDENGHFTGEVDIGNISLNASIHNLQADISPLFAIGHLFPNISQRIRDWIFRIVKPRLEAQANAMIRQKLNQAEGMINQIAGEIESKINSIPVISSLDAACYIIDNIPEFPELPFPLPSPEDPGTSEEPKEEGPLEPELAQPGDQCQSNSDCESGRCYGSGVYGTCG